MMKNLAISELKAILKFYNKNIPKTLHRVKVKANQVIVQNLCQTNCDSGYKYKKLLCILNKKRIITPQKKRKHEKTQKKYIMIYKQTRVRSPICYLDA